MDLSRGHFYKTIEEAETSIKEYSKEHYFVINQGSSKAVWDDSRRIHFLHSSGTITDEWNYFYSPGTIPDE